MKHKTYVLLPVLFCLTMMTGCVDSGLHQAIDGTVTLNGKPLAIGYISFRPKPGSPGPTAGAEIVDGQFSIARQDGTFAGQFRVEITASRPTGRKVPGRFTADLVDEFGQYLAAEYNTESTLTREVKADKENHFKFNLESN